MNIWFIILSMALVTYLLKLLPLTLLGENALPLWARRGLNYVPIAVLSALIGVSFVPSTDWLSFTLDAHLPAGIVAILIAWFTRNALLTIAGGMVVLLLLGR